MVKRSALSLRGSPKHGGVQHELSNCNTFIFVLFMTKIKVHNGNKLPREYRKLELHGFPLSDFLVVLSKTQCRWSRKIIRKIISEDPPVAPEHYCILMNGITGVCVGRCMVCTNPSHHAAFNTLYGGTATIARNTCEGPGFNSGICE